VDKCSKVLQLDIGRLGEKFTPNFILRKVLMYNFPMVVFVSF